MLACVCENNGPIFIGLCRRIWQESSPTMGLKLGNRMKEFTCTMREFPFYCDLLESYVAPKAKILFWPLTNFNSQYPNILNLVSSKIFIINLAPHICVFSQFGFFLFLI